MATTKKDNLTEVSEADYNFGLSQPVKPLQLKSTFKQGNPADSAMVGGEFSQPPTNSRPDRIGTGTRVVERSMAPATSSTVPKLREISDPRRDAELGKMNVSVNGNTVTYGIGNNTASYKLSDNDQQLKRNLGRIDQMIESGVKVSPKQMARINNIRQQAGFLRGGTDRTLATVNNGIQRVGNMDVQFDPSVTPEARKAFLTNPVEPTAQMNRYDQRQLAQIQTVPAINDPKPVMPTNRTSEAIADYNKAMGEWSNRQIARQGLDVSKDENRIQEMDVKGLNRLRDIQGQVEQNPVKEESKPIVIDSYEPDPINPIESIRKQRIVRQEPDGTFIDVTPQQQSNTTVNELPDNHPAIKFLRDNPSQASNFKAKYGYLPAWATGQ